ncbi:MAG: hypothetical protein LBG78_08300 [Azoarcus sp.]|jgi:hypothetical protein|nr:hypothetical protein [Azoarcus sp.]
MTKITQECIVIETMKKMGGFATFGQLNANLDFSEWKTKTPEASVRRIVQNGPFTRIRPGLWCLSDMASKVLKTLGLNSVDEKKKDNQVTDFDHSYMQGLLIQIGKLKNMTTYIPAQDKNRKYLGKTNLVEIADTTILPDFTYKSILKHAKTIDVIWFDNYRKMPQKFFEIEHSTDIRNSLRKFVELQDFRTQYFIVADNHRHRQYEDIIKENSWRDIAEFCKFISYENVVKFYEASLRIKEYQF